MYPRLCVHGRPALMLVKCEHAYLRTCTLLVCVTLMMYQLTVCRNESRPMYVLRSSYSTTYYLRT